MLPPRSKLHHIARFLLEELIVAQHSQSFPEFYGIRNLISVPTSRSVARMGKCVLPHTQYMKGRKSKNWNVKTYYICLIIKILYACAINNINKKCRNLIAFRAGAGVAFP
jgi:hypothetical protein